MDPNGQGQQQPAVTADGQGSGNGAGAPGQEGIQKRIDELVAQGKQYQEMLQKERENSQLLMASLTELSSRQITATQPNAELQVQVEPDEAAKIRAVMNPYLEEIRTMARSVAQQVGRQQFDQTAANPVYQDNRVRQRAQELMGAWQSRKLSGWTPEDAFKYAFGEVAAQDAMKAAASRGAANGYNSQSQVIPGGNGAPQLEVNSAIPSDINAWPLEKQLDFWEKRSGDKAF